MPYKEKEIEKLYYSISEVSTMLGVNNSTVRFWEKEFSILNPKKNKKGNRLFTPKDVKNLKLIYHLLKERGFTLDGAKKKISEESDSLDQYLEITERLKTIKSFLLELKKNL